MRREALPAQFPDLAAAVGAPVWTVPALLQARAEATPDAPALWSWAAGNWHSVGWGEYWRRAQHAARGLRALGLKRGDRVGIIAPTCAAWDIAQMAALGAGGVVVGLDAHDTDARLGQIAAQCGLAGVIAQDAAHAARVRSSLPSLRFAVSLAPSNEPGLTHFDDLAAEPPGSPPQDADFSAPDADALIVFTSGTTGEPKGIAYTHRQVCGAVAAILDAFPDIEAGSRLACWLPLSNLFQRMINLCAIGRGAQTFYVEDPRQIMEHVRVISPHLFIGVPRFYEKLHAGIREAIDAGPAWRRALARWAMRAGARRARAQRAGQLSTFIGSVELALAERVVLRRIRGALGTNLRYLVSGSAPMPAWLLEELETLGFVLLEAYGLSECIVPVAANRPDRRRAGTVGQPLASNEVRLAADGELMLRGPGVFRGYLGEASSPPERFDAEGFLATGDFASIDAEGFITLLGRKSELIKTSTGRRIAPAPIESRLRAIPYVEHALVVGNGRPFILAVLAVAEDQLRVRLGDTTVPDPAAVAAAVRADVAAALSDFPEPQRPAGVLLTTRALTIADGHLTPNLKLRRAAIEAAFAVQLAELQQIVASAAGKAAVAQRDGGSVLLIAA